MARRAPNYQFERNERTRAKERKRAERLERKRADAEKRKAERDGAPAPDSELASDTPPDD
jgi:hypothetical protein